MHINLESLLSALDLTVEEVKPYLKPAIFFEVIPSNPDSSSFLGGRPRLPTGYEWPDFGTSGPGNFIAQIDCASLPRSIDTKIGHFELPHFPENGTFYLFMALRGLEIWENKATCLAYSPEYGDALVQTDAPASLEDARGTNMDMGDRHLDETGLYLHKRTLVPTVHLTTPPENLLHSRIVQYSENNGAEYDDILDLGTIALCPLHYASTHSMSTAKQEPDFQFFDRGSAMQMFGYGTELQNAVSKNEDKTMLMQTGSCDGVPLCGHSCGLFQYWIKPEDLQAGRFEGVFHTAECT